jgi:DNA-binding transcriptional ArsR family regulator
MEFIDASRLASWVVSTDPMAYRTIPESIARLERAGLVVVRRRGRSIRYRRTPVGLVAAERVFEDGRLSFLKAVGGAAER